MNREKASLDDLRIDRRASASQSTAFWWAVIVLVLLLGLGAGIWWKFRPGAVPVRTVMVREVAGSGARTILNA